MSEYDRIFRSKINKTIKYIKDGRLGEEWKEKFEKNPGAVSASIAESILVEDMNMEEAMMELSDPDTKPDLKDAEAVVSGIIQGLVSESKK